MIEANRLKHGYYKECYGFYCKTCGAEISIPFNEIENISKTLIRNENGIPVKQCQCCGHYVEFIALDNAVNDYQKYIKNLKK